jgi:hypothetical protein
MEAAETKEQGAARKDLADSDTYVGRVLTWKNRYGWLEPTRDISHPEVARHNGRIYCAESDLAAGQKRLRPGSWVEFKLYVDEQGLGAREVTQRRVMRFTCPRDEADLALGSDGSAIPQLESQFGVTIRSFEWMLQDGRPGGLNFLLLEIWGRPAAIGETVAAMGSRVAASSSTGSFELNALIPESRVWKLDLRLLRQIVSAANLSKEFALTDPMPCRKLALTGSVDDVSKAVLATIAQVCDY